MRISYWSSDVCSSDLLQGKQARQVDHRKRIVLSRRADRAEAVDQDAAGQAVVLDDDRSTAQRRRAVAKPEPTAEIDGQCRAARQIDQRSEERRVGKECGRTVRSRWWPDHKKKK